LPAGQGAAAVIFDERGRVLLVKENYDRRRYSLPGGAVESGETPLDAVVRETREETGVEAGNNHLIGIYRLENGFAVHVFRCEILSGTPECPATDELSGVGWFPPESVPAPVSNVLHYALPDALAGIRGVVRDGLPRLT